MAHQTGRGTSPEDPGRAAANMNRMLSEPDEARPFGGLPPTTAARLEERGRRRHFAPGDVLLRQGEPGDSLHAIVRGRVRIERCHPNLLPTMLLAEAGPGEVVGQVGVLYREPRSATVTAVDETETLEIGGAALADVLAEKLQDALSLLRLLCQRAEASGAG